MAVRAETASRKAVATESAARQRSTGQIITYVLLLVWAVVTVLPFLYMVSTSFKESIFVLEFPPRFIPAQPTLDNYVRAWTSNNFAVYFKNSLLVALATTVITLLLSSMAAYSFARFNFRFKNFLFYLMLAMMMVPGMILIIPQFVLARTLGLIDQLPGLAVVYIAGGMAFNTYLLRGFFEKIPRELEEAVLLDGGNYFTIYRQIMLPLSTPALATVAIFSFLGSWDEYVWANTVINDIGKRTLPIGIALFQGQHASDWGLVFAASLIAVVPVLILYVSMQRYFVEGLMAGAVKG